MTLKENAFHSRGNLLFLLVLLNLWVSPGFVTAQTVPCSTSADCEEKLRAGSQCIEGFCTNPFYHGGCLKSLLPDWDKPRVCNSLDPPEAKELGYCRESPFNYTEVRIASTNWESANLGAWILQILLSEILDVPTSLEGGAPDVKTDLYDIHSAFDYAQAHQDEHYKEFLTSGRVKDCRTVYTDNPEEYEACFHLHPEMWWESKYYQVVEGIEAPLELGTIGEAALWIPKFAAERDLSLTSWLGYQGEENRRKMAETFQTPTRWGEYCELVSPTKCVEPDNVASRAPLDEYEKGVFFFEGEYTGHFRITPENNCDDYPNTCTGQVLDYQCGWLSFVRQQMHHLNIALKSTGTLPNNGYIYSDLVQIWRAANATQSPIIMQWWTPEPLYEEFMRTSAEFTRVLLPPPTQECVDARIDERAQCNTNLTWAEIYGRPEGACDTVPRVLQKVLGTSLREIAEDPTVHNVFWSPAYEAVRNYKLDNVQIGRIFDLWFQRNSDHWNFDPRDAACQWVVENMDLLQAYIPNTYPRVLDLEQSAGTPLYIAASSIAGVAAILVVGTIAYAYYKRNTKIMYYLQPEYMFLVLFGMLMVATGAIMFSMPPSTAVCKSQQWLTNLGYVLQLVPLVYRVYEINRMAAFGKQMQHIRVKPEILLQIVAAVGAGVTAFLLAWLILSPPREVFEYNLTNEINDYGETVVEAYNYCGWNEGKIFWYYLGAAWRAAVLLPGCILAWMSSQIKDDRNDTRAVSVVLTIHLVILMLQVVAFAMQQDERASNLAFQSMFLSADTIVALGRYVWPKFWETGEDLEQEPLPDVFVHTTIALIDVEGFSAWQSVREPVQVFQFLEQLYESYDQIAERCNVTKVETVAECYVAATGVPKKQPHHAEIMAKFAGKVMKSMTGFLHKAETQFGPDTSDLCLKIALHSGPVTGGFLKGKGARFQLFGDTMATAQLVLANTPSATIQMSEATANLLKQAGKKKWILEREDKVETLDKGILSTYYLVKGTEDKMRQLGLSHGDELSVGESEVFSTDTLLEESSSEQRWIEWNTKVFENLLRQIVARRTINIALGNITTIPLNADQIASIIPPIPRPTEIAKLTSFGSSAQTKSTSTTTASIPLEEVKTIIELPEFDWRAARRQRDNKDDIVLPKNVVEQLKEFITEVAKLYNDNPFHNFAHASYVVMAITKYMNRIIAASDADLGGGEDERLPDHEMDAKLHNHTYGITSDPLTQFACVFSALIHDADHPGVPNAQLIKEDAAVGSRYKERSVAEQKSLDLGLGLLREDRFKDLLSTVCGTPEELSRFRSLVINQVMATDLGDKELKELRNGRWQKAFAGCSDEEGNDKKKETEDQRTSTNRKATIVIEHLIQAADVAHMSQHWNIYRKWNERLFREMYKAYREGRSDSNPADSWYKGEIGFFDFYIIPLSKKLRDCGVFGATSDENLNYATNNRNMWVKNGEEITKKMLERVESEYNREEEGHLDEPLLESYKE